MTTKKILLREVEIRGLLIYFGYESLLAAGRRDGNHRYAKTAGLAACFKSVTTLPAAAVVAGGPAVQVPTRRTEDGKGPCY